MVNTNPKHRENSPASLENHRNRAHEPGLAQFMTMITTISGLFSPVPIEEMGPKYARKKDGAWIGLIMIIWIRLVGRLAPYAPQPLKGSSPSCGPTLTKKLKEIKKMFRPTAINYQNIITFSQGTP